MSVRLLNLTSLYQLIVLALASLTSLLVWRDGALSVFFGAGFGAMNFYALRQIVSRAYSGEGQKLIWGLVLALKMVTTLGVMAAMLFVLKLDPLGFGIGVATTFVGLFVAMGHIALTERAQARG